MWFSSFLPGWPLARILSRATPNHLQAAQWPYSLKIQLLHCQKGLYSKVQILRHLTSRFSLSILSFVKPFPDKGRGKGSLPTTQLLSKYMILRKVKYKRLLQKSWKYKIQDYPLKQYPNSMSTALPTIHTTTELLNLNPKNNHKTELFPNRNKCTVFAHITKDIS